MGTGYRYECKCGYEKRANLGAGFFTYRISKEYMEKLREGKLGQEAQRLAQDPNAGVYAEKRLFCCSACKKLEVEYVACLCTVVEKQPEDWTHEWPPESSIYISGYQVGWTHKVVFSQKNLCGTCGNPMKQIKGKKLKTVKCPLCGEQMSVHLYLWD